MDSSAGGYVCVPDMHNAESGRIKDEWADSENVESMYLATATFPRDVRQYLHGVSNLYVLARCADTASLEDVARGHCGDKSSFVFHTLEDLFERDSGRGTTFVGAYYLEYEAVEADVSNLASVVVKRDRVCKASVCDMRVHTPPEQRFDFPYRHAVVLEVSDEQSHKTVNKYCEKTRRNAQHSGVSMNNLAAFSILERLK